MGEPLLGGKKRSSLRRYLLVVCSFLLILGVFLVVYGSLNFRTQHTSKNIVERVGVVIDAGGSGTRMIIYSYSNNSMRQLKYGVCEDRGLTNYNKSELAILRRSLELCLRDGAVWIQNTSSNAPPHSQVPIYFAATAGMRLLRLRNKDEYENIWSIVKQTLAESDFNVAYRDTITGFEEAEWAWVAANYLKKAFKDGGTKHGTIDFGSSSLQVAFVADNAGKLSDDVKTITIDGKDIRLYGHSYLCYGSHEMSRRFLAKLVKLSNYASVVKNPCFFNGYSANFSSDYLWEPPCSSGHYAKTYLGEEITGPPKKTYTITGTSNFHQCSQLLGDLIEQRCSNHTSCGMNGEYQPNIHGHFFALSTFYYIGKGLGLDSSSSKEDFFQKAQAMCAKTWSEMIQGKASSRYVEGKCFQAAYGYYVLSSGLKFNASTWDIDYTKKISGTNVGWSLGLMYANKEEMWPTRVDYVKWVVEKPLFLAFVVIGPISIVLAILLLVIFKCREGSKGEGST